MTERVRIVGKNLKTREGWALNVSRGGVRAILEERVDLGEEYELTIGEEGSAALTRHARVVWVQDEPDGVIVGFEFLFTTGQNPIVTGEVAAVPPPPPDDDKDA
jgi:hypothetical protein